MEQVLDREERRWSSQRYWAHLSLTHLHFLDTVLATEELATKSCMAVEHHDYEIVGMVMFIMSESHWQWSDMYVIPNS